jgi:hypothetical protein
MNKIKFYLIRWHSDNQINIVSNRQIVAIRHSEKNWYDGIPQMTIIREATKDDLSRYTYEDTLPLDKYFK